MNDFHPSFWTEEQAPTLVVENAIKLVLAYGDLLGFSRQEMWLAITHLCVATLGFAGGFSSQYYPEPILLSF